MLEKIKQYVYCKEENHTGIKLLPLIQEGKVRKGGTHMKEKCNLSKILWTVIRNNVKLYILVSILVIIYKIYFEKLIRLTEKILQGTSVNIVFQVYMYIFLENLKLLQLNIKLLNLYGFWNTYSKNLLNDKLL